MQHLAVTLVGDLAFLLDIYALCILVWAFMTFFPGVGSSPFGQLLDSLVMPVIRPLRRALPVIAGMDFSPVLAIVLVYAVAEAMSELANSGFVNPVGIIVQVVLGFIDAILLVLLILMLIRVLIGFLHVDPWHPFVFAVRRITDSLINPFRRFGQGEVPVIVTFVVVLVVFVAATEFLFPVIQTGVNQL